MSNTHISNMQNSRHRDALRAVHDELLALVLRREAHRRAEEQTP